MWCIMGINVEDIGMKARSYNQQPWWSYLFLKRKTGYEVICLGDNVAVRSIFQLEDSQNRKYYLCSDNNLPLEFNQWQYL